MTTIKLEGIGEVDKALRELEMAFGDKLARSKVLIPAVREAMKPVLALARSQAPEDSGGLKRSLQIEARRPTNKDRRSKYVTQTDTVMAAVTTAPGKKLAKLGVASDARAVAQEFGTARHPAHPYLRSALESQSQTVVQRLSEILVRRIDEFKRTHYK
ncbi:MAG: HK97-gp10 family putative phage morphogenesis protein [Burkholderiaceae bacterium]